MIVLYFGNLNVRRIQLLFKDHKGMEGKLFINKTGRNININTQKYDENIQMQIQSNKQIIPATSKDISDKDDSDNEKDIQVATTQQKMNDDYVDVPVDVDEEYEHKEEED